VCIILLQRFFLVADTGWNEPTGKIALFNAHQVTLVWKNNSSNKIETVCNLDQFLSVAKFLLEITTCGNHVRLSITVIRGLRAFYFSVGQQPNLGLGPLIVEVSRSHRVRHTHSWWESSARRRGRYLHSTYQTRGTNIHAPSGI